MISNKIIQILIFISCASACCCLYFGHVFQTPNSISLSSRAHSLTTLHGLHCIGALPEVINAAPRPGLSKPAWSPIMSFLSSLDNQMQRTQRRSPDFRRLWSHQPEAAPVSEWLHDGEPLQTYILEIKLHYVQWVRWGGYSQQLANMINI